MRVTLVISLRAREFLLLLNRRMTTMSGVTLSRKHNLNQTLKSKKKMTTGLVLAKIKTARTRQKRKNKCLLTRPLLLKAKQSLLLTAKTTTLTILMTSRDSLSLLKWQRRRLTASQLSCQKTKWRTIQMTGVTIAFLLMITLKINNTCLRQMLPKSTVWI